jgi:hypothetical protein
MSDIQDIVDALKGVARDIRNEVLAIDTDIDLEGYVETMIDAPVIRALAARGLGDDDAARLRLEVAMRDLLMDFDAEVLTSNDAEFYTAEYADTVLRPLLTTTCGLAA